MTNEPEPPQPYQPFQPPADRELYIRSLALKTAAALQLQHVAGWHSDTVSRLLQDAAKIADWLRAP